MKWKWLLIVNFYCSVTAAQPWHFKLYNTENGLSSNYITSVQKDNNAFVWIGTQNGLNRFDGNAFDNFYNNPGDSTTIASNYIQAIFISAKNKLWAGTASGISSFTATTQQFNNYAPDTLVMPKIGQNFNCINEDEDENIWVGCRYDLLIFNTKTKKFKSTGWAKYADAVKPVNGNHRRVVILNIVKKNKQEFWVLTTYGLFSVHTKSLQFAYYPYAGIDDYYGCNIGYTDENNNLWISTYNKGLLLFNTAKLQWKNFNLPQNYLNLAGWNNCNSVAVYNNDTLIIAANKGIALFDKKREQFISFISKQNNNEIILPENGIINVQKNDAGFWVNSGSGLLKMQQQKTNFSFTPIKDLAMVYRMFYSAAAKQTVMGNFFTTSGFYNSSTKKYTVLKNNPQAVENGVRAYTEINKDTAYLCTDQNLYLINPTTYAIKEIPLPAKLHPQNPNTLRNIVVDKYGMLWIRLRAQGIYRFNPKTQTGSYTSFIPGSLTTDYTALYYDSASNCIFAGVLQEGVYVYDIDKQKAEKFLLNIPPSQRGANITGIAGNNKGQIFLTEEYNGFFVYTTAGKKFKRYTIFNGLQSNNCNGLCSGADSLVWIATNTGVSCFNTITQQFKNFGKAQQHIGFADFIMADNNGTIYQPWQNGYLSWHNSMALQPAPTGKIYLRHCNVNGSNWAIDSIYNFTASQNNISFQFGYLLQQNDNAVNFQYQLNSSNWLPVSAGNKISFSSLAPGAYTLLVTEKSDAAQIYTLHFTINPPYYKKWWFIALISLLSATLLFAIIKNRIAIIKKQAALKQKIAETEMMALRAQMNPHFIFNCISSIDNFILDNDKENASSYLNKFAKLIRNILDSSKNDVVPFWKDWETMHLYLQLEQLRSNNSFVYELKADEALLNGHYKIPPLIIQPYIENAIHHGLNLLTERKGVLKITAQLYNNQLRYCIEDNGVGRSKAIAGSYTKSSHQSYGMQLTKERIALFNEQDAKGNIEITDNYTADNIPCGTTVYVHLKI